MVLEATEQTGFRVTGEMTQLNSYENRVFDLRLERSQDLSFDRVITKFYRPGRWSKEAILEEHAFLHELSEEGFAVSAPYQLTKSTLGESGGLFFAVFPRIQGRMPTELLNQDWKRVGAMLARIHNVGARKRFLHRPRLSETPFSPWETLELLQNWVAPELWHRYESAAIELIEKIENQIDSSQFIRIHGDCHRGNLILLNDQLSMVDFDDCGMGPAVQDFWMLFTSELGEEERDILLDAYTEFREFDSNELKMIPWLRGLRILSYAGWIARRWEDPSFQRIFPQFGSYTQWAEDTEAIERLIWQRDKL